MELILISLIIVNLIGGNVEFQLGIIDNIEDGIGDFIDSITDGLRDFIDAVASAISYPFSLLKSAFYDSYDWFTDHFAWGAPIAFTLVVGITIILIIAIVKKIPDVIA